MSSVWYDNEAIPWVKDNLIGIVTLGMSNIVVYFVPDVFVIIGVIGGFSTVIISFVDPILIYVAMSKEKWTHWKIISAMFILTIMVVLGCIATVKRRRKL